MSVWTSVHELFHICECKLTIASPIIIKAYLDLDIATLMRLGLERKPISPWQLERVVTRIMISNSAPCVWRLFHVIWTISVTYLAGVESAEHRGIVRIGQSRVENQDIIELSIVCTQYGNRVRLAVGADVIQSRQRHLALQQIITRCLRLDEALTCLRFE